MTTIRTIMVEDETRSANVLKTLIEEHCPEIELVGHAQTVKDAIEEIKKWKPVLVFLEIGRAT